MERSLRDIEVNFFASSICHAKKGHNKAPAERSARALKGFIIV